MAVHHENRPAPIVVATTTTTSTATTVPPTAIEALVQRLEAYVVRTRGLSYKRPVRVTLLDDAAFRARLTRDSDDDAKEAETTGKVLRALGLIPANLDLKRATASLLSSAVLGFYDAKTKELVVRGDDSDRPEVREVLVHELTHALQDQWFGLDRPEIDKKDDDTPLGFQTVVEGDAVRIQDEYHATLSAADQRKVDLAMAQQSRSIDPSIPPVLLQAISFPYAVGPAFTRALLAAGGQARLDHAFTTPPTTSEHLLHPDLYLAGEEAKPVAEPKAEGAVIDRNVVGEFGLLLLLNGVDSAASVRQAAAGWGGDRYVAWDAGGRTCVRADIVMDTPADTQQLLAGLERWRRNRPGATVTGTGPVTLTSCG